MDFVWIYIVIFFVKLDFKNNTMFPVGYLFQCTLPPAIMTPAIMTGQKPISIQYNSNDLFSIGKSTKDNLNPNLLKTVKPLEV